MTNLIENLLLAAAALCFYWGLGLWIAAFNPPENVSGDDDWETDR